MNFRILASCAAVALLAPAEVSARRRLGDPPAAGKLLAALAAGAAIAHAAELRDFVQEPAPGGVPGAGGRLRANALARTAPLGDDRAHVTAEGGRAKELQAMERRFFQAMQRQRAVARDRADPAEGGRAKELQAMERRFQAMQLVARDPAVSAEGRELAMSQYHLLGFGDTCPAGREIGSESECSDAILSLGITGGGTPWVGRRTTMPSGCSVQKNTNTMIFNSEDGGSGRHDLAPVCKAMRPPNSSWPWCDMEEQTCWSGHTLLGCAANLDGGCPCAEGQVRCGGGLHWAGTCEPGSFCCADNEEACFGDDGTKSCVPFMEGGCPCPAGEEKCAPGGFTDYWAGFCTAVCCDWHTQDECVDETWMAVSCTPRGESCVCTSGKTECFHGFCASECPFSIE